MKQTVVEWLIDQLEKKGDASVNMSIGRMQISIIEEDYINLLEQAKEMEKQQSDDYAIEFAKFISNEDYDLDYWVNNSDIKTLLETFKNK